MQANLDRKGHLAAMKTLDYYEFLQISPNADHETIHRVYRFLAARFHPDNPKSGDADKFNLLKSAYDVLSDPERRAEYDATREDARPKTAPLSSSVDFMDQVEGELNRRLALLAVLYFRRRGNPYAPEVPLAEIERHMGFPRDYLDFTTWYLEKKGYITKADNSDFTLTAAGVDFVETQRATIPVLNRLLTTGNEPVAADTMDTIEASVQPSPSDKGVLQTEHLFDRRAVRKDRRIGAPDLRTNPVERRMNRAERRAAAQASAAAPAPAPREHVAVN